jgi:hypothetical protein
MTLSWPIGRVSLAPNYCRTGERLLFGFVAGDTKLLVVLVCLAVGGIMAVLGATGSWPPRRRP